jgi:hypothetical protein
MTRVHSHNYSPVIRAAWASPRAFARKEELFGVRECSAAAARMIDPLRESCMAASNERVYACG